MKFFLSILLTVFTLPTFAGEFLTLEMGDAHMRARNGNDTIALKRELRQQHNIRARDLDLLSVTLVAKTKQGRGKAHLLVGQTSSAKQGVGGNPGDFRSHEERSFDRVLFKNPKQDSQGKWQLKLQGNYIVHQVVVEVAEDSMTHLTLNYNHLHIRTGRGDNNTLKLKRKMRQEHNMHPSDYEIVGATIVAKSKQGQGKTSFSVGGNSTDANTLNGSPSVFHDSTTYYEVKMDNPSSSSNGAWQIQLQGNVKVKEVILHLKEKQF